MRTRGRERTRDTHRQMPKHSQKSELPRRTSCSCSSPTRMAASLGPPTCGCARSPRARTPGATPRSTAPTRRARSAPTTPRACRMHACVARPERSARAWTRWSTHSLPAAPKRARPRTLRPGGLRAAPPYSCLSDRVLSPSSVWFNSYTSPVSPGSLAPLVEAITPRKKEQQQGPLVRLSGPHGARASRCAWPRHLSVSPLH